MPIMENLHIMEKEMKIYSAKIGKSTSTEIHYDEVDYVADFKKRAQRARPNLRKFYKSKSGKMLLIKQPYIEKKKEKKDEDDDQIDFSMPNDEVDEKEKDEDANQIDFSIPNDEVYHFSMPNDEEEETNNDDLDENSEKEDDEEKTGK